MISEDDSPHPPQTVIFVPGFHSSGLIPPSKSQESLSLIKDWSEIQNWYATHDGEGRELPRHPRVEDYDKDYVQYLDEELEIRDSNEEDSNLSSIQEEESVNAPRGPGYAPRAPTYDSDTIEWYRFFDEVSLSAREVQCPPIPESSYGPSMQSTANTKSAKATAKGKGKTWKSVYSSKWLWSIYLMVVILCCYHLLALSIMNNNKFF
nr:hypothetical protein Iba_chr10eCG9380 [Ipomoea batatas]